MSRILYFSRDYTTHDYRFLSSLAQTEHKVYYLRLERRGHQLEDRALPQQIEQIQWAGGHKPARWQDGYGLLRDLKRVIRSIKPDLIQAGPLQRSAFLVALTGFQPLISMSWGYDLIHDADTNSLWRWITRYTLKNSAVMIGDCDYIRRLAISYGMSNDRIVTFPWGINLEDFVPNPGEEPQKPERIKSKDATFTLISTRGWEPIYGIDLIARAFATAAHRHPELRMLMLGNGSQASEIRGVFNHAKVGEQVLFPGQVSQSELPRLYRAADLYISASHSDGTSISLLEAMASGLPALVSDIPGNQEWITPGENGWLFPDGDADALARSITLAIKERDKLAEMGKAARELAEERADWGTNFQAMLGAYELAFQVSA